MSAANEFYLTCYQILETMNLEKEETNDWTTAQYIGVLIYVLCMGFGMFDAGYTEGQQAVECAECKQNYYIPKYHGPIFSKPPVDTVEYNQHPKHKASYNTWENR